MEIKITDLELSTQTESILRSYDVETTSDISKIRMRHGDSMNRMRLKNWAELTIKISRKIESLPNAK